MESRIAAVIFDFEGTLVDFQWRLAEAEAQLREVFVSLGYGAAGNYAELWNAAAERAVPQGRLAELRRVLGPVYDRWDADALARWRPRPGAAEVLRELAARGLRTGMVSNIGRAALTDALARFGFDRRLAPVVSRDDVDFMKPRAEGILSVLAQWRMTPQDALFVGDSKADVAAARAAGMPVAILRNGECAESEFDALPPDGMVSDLERILAW